MKILKTLIITAFLASFLSSCAAKKTSIEENERPVEEILSDARIQFKKKNYKEAAELFSKIAYEFPYYDQSVSAQAMEIYCYFELGNYDKVEILADEFLHLHPADNQVSYVYYIRALSFYNQINIPQRDQELTEKAKAAFEQLIARFPESDYARDAKFKLDLVNDHIAAQHMDVGRYYLKSGNPVAAINRFKLVADKFQTTMQIEEALFRLAETYNFIGQKEEAKKYISVLAYNYPNSKWYKYSHKFVK